MFRYIRHFQPALRMWKHDPPIPQDQHDHHQEDVEDLTIIYSYIHIYHVLSLLYHDEHDHQQEDDEGQTIAKPHAFPASWGHCTLPRQVLFPQMSDASLLFFLLFWKTQKLTQFSPQPVQNVGRARHQGLSRQHSTSNLGGCNHLLKFFQFFPPLLQIINYHLLKFFQFFHHWNNQLVLYSHWLEQSCKTIDRVCFSCYNVCQWILKGEYSSWFNLGAKEFSSFVWCFGSFIDFLCAHAADTEGRDADSLVWLWQASHRF